MGDFFSEHSSNKYWSKKQQLILILSLWKPSATNFEKERLEPTLTTESVQKSNYENSYSVCTFKTE